MAVTAEQLEMLRGALSPDEYSIVEWVVSGTPLQDISTALRMGEKRLYRSILKAEALIGQRIRRGHGRRPGESAQYIRPQQVAPRQRVVPPLPPRAPVIPGCPRCGLRGEHRCIDATEHTYGIWMGEVESSVRERLSGGRR